MTATTATTTTGVTQPGDILATSTAASLHSMNQWKKKEILCIDDSHVTPYSRATHNYYFPDMECCILQQYAISAKKIFENPSLRQCSWPCDNFAEKLKTLRALYTPYL
ncbi:hypothetical protein DINM_006732 [Dirofilaria immitis]|nr:hypothetical protein [Dirofilaria immitis]